MQATLDQALRRLGDTSDPLADFKLGFTERYGPSEVPFLEVLDEELGLWQVGVSLYLPQPDSPLLENIRLTQPSGRVSIPWGEREELFLRLIASAKGGACHQVTVDLEMLAPLVAEALPLPDAFSVGVVLIGSPESVAEGRALVYVQGFRGPSGAKVLGRFCHADPELHSHVERHLRAEEALSQGSIIAEVAYYPEGRIANVVLRPVLREYEIAYLGKSGAPSEAQIPVSDLLVSVIDDRVVLRSRRLDRPIIPSFTNAMGGSQSPAAYAFMERVASQGVCGSGGFSWYPFDRMKFLPRVVMGRIVLCPAQWTLSRADLEGLRQTSAEERFRAAAAALRQQRGLPRHVALVDRDARLPVDFDNVLSVEAFAHSVRHRQEVRVAELLASSEALCVTGPEGRFTHELVIPFIQERAPVSPPARRRAAVSTRHRFLPGSEWFYAKLYASASLLDRIICSVIPPLLEALRREGLLSCWFFVRYADPDWHLRLRLKGTTRSICSSAISLLEGIVQPMCENGLVQRLELGTYEPEVSRYGGPQGMELAEEIFEADSDAVLKILQSAPAQNAHRDWRWQLALCGTDQFLPDFGLSLEERHAFVRAVSDAYFHKLGGNPKLKRQLSEKFRSRRSEIEQLLDGASRPDHLAPGLAALRIRSARIAPVAEQVRLLSQTEQLKVPLGAWLRSALHMHANRLLRSPSRPEEMIIADLLRRSYESRIARRVKGRP